MSSYSHTNEYLDIIHAEIQNWFNLKFKDVEVYDQHEFQDQPYNHYNIFVATGLVHLTPYRPYKMSYNSSLAGEYYVTGLVCDAHPTLKLLWMAYSDPSLKTIRKTIRAYLVQHDYEGFATYAHNPTKQKARALRIAQQQRAKKLVKKKKKVKK